ncbi:MAG: hypothetical protein M1831_000872 [Alyxoria varia]|nr:MAG: hypothetical protein M1831_000872 [Alyxoria varia]
MARNISSRLSDKVAIITGASSGIGRAMALRYAAEGARIVCVDLQECGSAEAQNVEEATTTHKLINDKNGEAIFVQADVGESQGWERIVGAAVEWKGKIDVLVNNAGISLESKNPQPIHLVPDEQYDQTMRVNARSVFLGCKHVITQMLKQDAIVDSASLGPARTKRRQRGAIVNISSIYGLVGDKLVCEFSLRCVTYW